MNLSAIKNQQLIEQLYKIDRDLAHEYRKRPCPYCGSVVHFANYARKTRSFIDYGSYQRFSLCCSTCRKRVFVPSTLFFRRFVYGAISFIVISCFFNKSGFRDKRLAQSFKISLKTIKRWKIWWGSTFKVSSFWKENKGRFVGPLINIPKDIIHSFKEDESFFIFMSHFK